MSAVLAIEVENISRTFGERTALQSVSFSVAAGEIFGLLGPNGGGKTTLFRILATVLRASSGVARIFGDDVVARRVAVRNRIGVVFQSPSVDLKLTVAENLRHQGHLYGLHGAALEARMSEVLERLGVSDRRNDRVETLSGGLRRRVEIAKGLLHRPSLLLLDEPSSGLDAGVRRDLRNYLQQLRDQDGVTVCLTTHFMDEAESCDRLAILDLGRLVSLGTPETLKSRIGGDVIVLETRDAESLKAAIQARFGNHVNIVNGQVRLERPQGHRFVTDLVEAFPGQIEAITIAKPTLEDVFIHETGHQFWEESHASGAR
ncbi:MAG TPA: ATP-binding cassette domain-containing protein [Candidatus Xenobia bacterium]|nr:ATP-binding cassette domain-containing protein [Candidatus Xenobia bacterium]